MSGEKKNRTLPGRGASFLAGLLAFLLTGTLLAALCSGAALFTLSSGDLHTRAALNAGAVDLQMDRIRENVTGLAEEYGFEAKPILDLITRESIEDLDREIAVWWTASAVSGKLGESPAYDLTAAESLLRKDEAFISSLDPMMVNATVQSILQEIGKSVKRSSVLFRDTLVQAAAGFAGKERNLPEIFAAAGRIPGIACAASLLLAGLIALLMSRSILTAGKYIGGALAACALLWLGCMGLIHTLDLGGMIAEASALLSAQFAQLSHDLTMLSFAAAAVLLIAGILMMVPAGKAYRKGNESHG